VSLNRPGGKCCDAVNSGFDPELTLGPLIGCKTLVMLAVSALPIRVFC